MVKLAANAPQPQTATMSYTIHTNKPFFTEVHHIVDSQAHKGLNNLPAEEDLEEAIHDIRKRCKKIRAAWRLVRDELGGKEYKKRNRYYRDTARLISDLRDATAIIEALDMLEERFGDTTYKSAFTEMRQALQKRRDEHLPETDNRPEVMAEVEKRLEQGIQRINPIPLKFENWSKTVKSVTRTYARAYRLYHEMKEEPSSETMHQWRKRTKYLRYELRLLKKVWPAVFNPWRKQLHKLSDWQGDHHDLHELKSVMRGMAEVSPATRRTLMALATQYQEYCYAMAMPLGKRLFAEKPKHFAKRLKNYLQVWGKEPKQPIRIRVAFQ